MSEEVFDNEVYPGPTQRKFSIRVDDSKGIAFEATQGMTREDFKKKNEQAVDDLFKLEEIGGVFEKGPTLEEKSLAKNRERMGINDSNSGIGIDANEIKALKQELDSQSTKIKEPSIESSFGLLK